MGKAYIKPYAVGADKAIANIQNGLIEALPWLDVAFGRAERRVRMASGKSYYFPAVYVGAGGFKGIVENEYISAEPNDVLGNSCFFEIDDPQNYGTGNETVNDIAKLPVSIIFWLDMRKLFAKGVRNCEDVKLQVLSAIKDMNLAVGGTISIAQVFERTENIYRGYGLKETDMQYLTHPYYGLRVAGTLFVEDICESPLPSTVHLTIKHQDVAKNPISEDITLVTQSGNTLIVPQIEDVDGYVSPNTYYAEDGTIYLPGSEIILYNDMTIYAVYEMIPVVKTKGFLPQSQTTGYFRQKAANNKTYGKTIQLIFDATNEGGFLFSQTLSTALNTGIILQTAGGGRLYSRFFNAIGYISPSSMLLTPGKTYDVTAIVAEKTTGSMPRLTAYINGISTGSVLDGTAEYDLTNAKMCLGAFVTGQYPWSSGIRLLRVFNRVLTQSEITLLHNNGKPLNLGKTTIPDCIVELLPDSFNISTNPENGFAKDTSGTGNDFEQIDYPKELYTEPNY